MRCSTCNYPLWNLTARSCPECGRPFKPSERTFRGGAVRFCCPRCDQAYYGTSPAGHLFPRSFTCVTCGAAVDMDEMVLRPAEGVTEEQTRQDRAPWLDGGPGRWAPRWLATVGRALVAPASFMRAVPADAPLLPALAFLAVSVAIFLLGGLGAPLLAIAVVLLVEAASDATGPLTAAAVIVPCGAAGFASMALLWGLVAHGLLRLTGTTAHGVRQTCQAICYSAGACAAMAIPILGVYPFFFVPLTWWIVSACLMVAEGQRVGGFRAALAVVMPPVLLVVGLISLIIVGTASSARTAMIAAASATVDAECALVTEALVAHAQGGAWPVHAVEMVDSSFTGWELVGGPTATTPERVPVGTTNLAAVWTLGHGERASIAAAAAASLPAGVVAHRLGDFVFTYHGVDPGAPDPVLWIVVMSPDPDQNGERFISGSLLAGTGDGALHVIGESEFDAQLVRQNELRRVRGLPPLPPPWEVTHAGPAIAP
jgi:hypothetical protein